MSDSRFALLKDRRILALWSAQTVSAFGDMLTFLALPILVYEVTGSKAALSFTIFIGGVPSILVGPFAGALADRLDRRWIMVLCDLSRALVTVPIILAAENMLIPRTALIPTIYLVVGLKSVLGSFFQPAMSSVIPSLVKRDRLMSVNSIFTFSFRTLQFLAPLIGTALVIKFGVTAMLLVDVFSFVLSGILIRVTAIPAHEKREDNRLTFRSLARDIHDGLGYIKGSKILQIMLLTGIITMFGQGFISPVWLPYVVEVLEKPAESFGILVSLQGFGCVVGSAYLMVTGARKKHSVKGMYMVFLAGSGIAIFMQISTTYFPIFLCWATLAGFFIAGRNVTTSTLMQHATEQQMMGRVNSTFQILNRAAMMLAVLIVGVGAENSKYMSTRFLFILAASLWLVGTLSGTIRIAFEPEPRQDDGEDT